jgi:integrase
LTRQGFVGKSKQGEPTMGIYRRKDSPVWWMSFLHNGRQYQKSTGTEDRETAKKIFTNIQAKVALNQWIPEEREQRKEYTFKELVNRYAEYAEGRVRSWERSIKPTVFNILLPVFEGYILDILTSHDLEKYQTSLIRKGLAVATINKYITIFKMLIAKAEDWNMCSAEVLQKIRKVKQLKGANKRLRFLSQEECQTLIAACDPHLKPVIVTALNTGMRKGEILNLRWDNVDLKHGIILLDKTKNGERREIPINNTLRGVLQGIPRRLDIPYVFPDNSTGKPFGDVKKAFASAIRRAKIIDFTFHDLRHTFASHLVMAGVDLTTVKELLGHKDIKMTLRYAHLASSHKVEAVRKMEAFLSQKIDEKEPKYYAGMTLRVLPLTADCRNC